VLSNQPLGDYKIGETLLRESATVIELCEGPPPEESMARSEQRSQSIDSSRDLDDKSKELNSKYMPLAKFQKYRSLTKYVARRDSAPPERRLLITAVGIKPPGNSKHWSSCLKPGESCIRYFMLNGIPSIIIPAKAGCPLIAWDTLTLKSLHEKEKKAGAIHGVADVILEYLTFCVDWDRMTLPSTSPSDATENKDGIGIEKGKEVLKDAVAVLVAGVIKSKYARTVNEEVDLERAGIVMFRIP
jgi:hypothetical protein